MLDYLLRGGTLADGSGAPTRQADLGIRGNRIVAVGAVDEAAHQVMDLDGHIVCPGFIDPHTHYDAQLWWDPQATPSSWHGVTTVIGGNCGFTLAPLKARDADYTRRMMAQVEGMPLAALENGLEWSWESFGEYLDGLEGRIAVNAGFLVGHCALRRYVIGEESTDRESTPAELEAIEALLRDCLAAGGLGFSTSRSSTHNDAEGRPVPSRLASEDEVLTLCAAAGDFEGTSIEAMLQGCLDRFSDSEIELLAAMSARAGRPLNWNVLGVSARDSDRAEHQLRPAKRARELGGRVVALSMPALAESNMSFLTFCGLWLIPGWREVLDRPVPDRIARLRDPLVREKLLAAARGAGTLGGLARFDRYLIGDVFSEANESAKGRIVGEIAAERGQDAFECLVEIVANDDLRTVLWPLPGADGAEDWALRQRLWANPDVLLGGSDAGAHLDRMLGSTYPTRFLADCLRGRKLLALETAVHLMTARPAALFGLKDRGQLVAGALADIVVFDPDKVDATPARIAFDLPGKSKRLLADPIGIERVFVNGVVSIEAGKPTGELPGQVLRSGRDTTTQVLG